MSDLPTTTGRWCRAFDPMHTLSERDVAPNVRAQVVHGEEEYRALVVFDLGAFEDEKTAEQVADEAARIFASLRRKGPSST